MKTSGTQVKSLKEAYSAQASDVTVVDDKSAKNISNQAAGLSREEKGVVSSVFAKVIEGAEILGPAKVIDKKICDSQGTAGNVAGKCHHQSNSNTNHKLSDLFVNNDKYSGKEHSPWDEHTSTTISKDTAELSREEKGVVSSVFAKVIEGAEIL